MAKYWFAGVAALALMNGAALAQTSPSQTAPAAASAPAAAAVQKPAERRSSAFETGQSYTRSANQVEAEQDRTTSRSSVTLTTTQTAPVAPPVTTYQRERVVAPNGDSSTETRVTTTPGR